MRLEWSRRRDIRHTIDAAIPSDEIILNHPLHPKQEVELTIIPEQINEVSGVELERKSAGPGSVGRPFSGRDDRVGEEMQILTSPDTCRADPDIAWERLKTLVRKPKELAVLIEIAAWREREAQSRGRVLKDDAIGDIATHAPTTPERLASLRSLPRGFERSKWGQDILDAVARGLARDPAGLPPIERPRQGQNGNATVELLKVLLRMASERHGVAAKVIATVEDLERLALDDRADVPALHGWRREMFGDQAIALKRGKLALAVDRGRVVAVERE